MKLNYDKKSKDPTYFIQMGVRNGKKVTTKNIKRIGKHSELLAITPDPLAYAKEQVEIYNREYKEGKIDMQFKVDFDEKLLSSDLVASKSISRNIGYFILQHIYHDLKLKDYFASVLSNSKITFPCNDINRFLTFGRILDPQSKLGTFNNLDSFYEQPSHFDYQHILRHLDVLAQNFDSYLEHLFEQSNNVVKRDTSVCYFDCTNYYFEIDSEDEDCIDPATGEVFRGIRKFGISKEHRPNPLVQMGLFMDGNGIPISMCINPGNANERVCAVPLERKITKMFKGERFIYCADAGLGSFPIRKYNSLGGRAYIVTQSIKLLPETLKEAVFSDCDYRRKSDGIPVSIQRMKEFDCQKQENRDLYEDTFYKVLDAPISIDTGLYDVKACQNGKIKTVKVKGMLDQRIIITFSRKFMEYQRALRNAQIERAKKFLASSNPDDRKKGLNDARRFIKRVSTGRTGEKAIDHYSIDQSVIEEEERYDGYYAIATNLDTNEHEDVLRILKISHQRYRIEDCFRIMKSNFGTRPVYLSDKDHIIGHFLVCYTALLIFRLLQTKLDQYGTHFTTESILETLRNMNVLNIQDSFYAAAYTSSQVCTNLNAVFDLGLNKKYYLPKDLNRKLKKISG